MKKLPIRVNGAALWNFGYVLEFVDLFPFFGIRRENEKMGTDLFYYTGFPIKPGITKW